MGLVFHHGRCTFQHIICDQILTDNGDDHTGRAHIFLYTAVYDGKFGYIQGLRQEAGRNIGYQILAFCIGQFFVYSTVDGIVHTDIYVISVIIDGQIGTIRNIRKCLIFRRSNLYSLAVFGSLLISFLCPLTGNDVVSNFIFHQIHGNHGKLQGCAALKEQYFIIIRNMHQIAQICFRFFDDIVEYF